MVGRVSSAVWQDTAGDLIWSRYYESIVFSLFVDDGFKTFAFFFYSGVKDRQLWCSAFQIFYLCSFGESQGEFYCIYICIYILILNTESLYLWFFTLLWMQPAFLVTKKMEHYFFLVSLDTPSTSWKTFTTVIRITRHYLHCQVLPTTYILKLMFLLRHD